MTKRMITSDLYEDDFFIELDLFSRLVWIGLITGCADDQGRMQDNPVLIRSKIFPTDDIKISDIKDSLNKICLHGKIVRYTAHGKALIQIANWWKHQSPRWAGRSNYDPPDGWTDRERYHGSGNILITKNWDSIGGYIAPNTTREVKVNDEVKVKDDIKDESEGDAPDLYDITQSKIASVVGILPVGEAGIKAVTEIMNMGATLEDIQAGFEWLKDNRNGKPVQYYTSLVGPIRVAMAKRLQADPPLQKGKQYEEIIIDGQRFMKEVKP